MIASDFATRQIQIPHITTLSRPAQAGLSALRREALHVIPSLS